MYHCPEPNTILNLVQKWKMLPADFSEKEGDLTPTLKLKRNVVTAKYEALIESIY